MKGTQQHLSSTYCISQENAYSLFTEREPLEQIECVLCAKDQQATEVLHLHTDCLMSAASSELARGSKERKLEVMLNLPGCHTKLLKGPSRGPILQTLLKLCETSRYVDV